MAEDADADAAGPQEATPPPAANPDAQTTVNDFLDYTEFFPSDLVRSLRLIGDLDQTYVDATQQVHQLTTKYGKLPTLPASERSDPVALRRDIALALDKAIYARESSYAEASRLYEVAERHKHRIGIIKRKLQAQPEPPSRDPTPVPVSPQAARPLNRNFPAQHLRLALDGRYGAGSTARERDRNKSRVPLPGGRMRSASFSDASDDSEVRSNTGLAVAPKRLKSRKDKTPRPPKVRVRPLGVGTNVHSSLAGISTSNALARLSPPPEDAKPGSKWAPWFKLTEYEMAVLRKKMKKNAIWKPSDTMIKRQLELGGRGQEAYARQKKLCEETGEEFLDEEPVTPTLRTNVPPAVGDPLSASVPTAAPTAVPAERTPTEIVPTPIEPSKDAENDEDDSRLDTPEARDMRQSKRDSRRQQAIRDTRELENATRRIKEAADWMQELSFSKAAKGQKSAVKAPSKRKRDSSPQPAGESQGYATREPSLASQDSGAKLPDPKRPKLSTSIASVGASTPRNLTPIAPSPAIRSPVPLPESSKAISIQIPLAPAGPSTPKAAAHSRSALASRPGTPAVLSPALPMRGEAQLSPAVSQPAASQANVTAASTRPRRESGAPKLPKLPSPGPASAPLAKKSKAATPGPDAASSASGQQPRPRSRGHVHTPKASSEEPKPPVQGSNARELRRHSIFSHSVTSPSGAPTRTSTRKKPPPKGEITNGEGGQKTVTNTNRAQGHKSRRKKKSEDESGPVEEIDPDEETYCICNDVSFGSMILCDNQCERQWFHYGCVGLEEGELPSRRAKWYCPDCRVALGTDQNGNPSAPPPLPGRRGNR